MEFRYLALGLSAIIVVATSDSAFSRYDHLDIDTILKNDRTLNSYLKCLLDKGPCTSEGRQLKTDIPKAIRDSCGSCTEKQKEIVRKAAKHVIKNRPKDWDQIVKHYDPESKFHDNFDKFLNEVN